jgi:hypothetical protein
MNAYTGSEGVAPFILCATLRPLYTLKISRMFIEFETPWNSEPPWMFCNKRKVLSSTQIRTSGCPVHKLVDVLTTLPLLREQNEGQKEACLHPCRNVRPDPPQSV